MLISNCNYRREQVGQATALEFLSVSLQLSELQEVGLLVLGKEGAEARTGQNMDQVISAVTVFPERCPICLICAVVTSRSGANKVCWTDRTRDVQFGVSRYQAK